MTTPLEGVPELPISASKTTPVLPERVMAPPDVVAPSRLRPPNVSIILIVPVPVLMPLTEIPDAFALLM